MGQNALDAMNPSSLISIQIRVSNLVIQTLNSKTKSILFAEESVKIGSTMTPRIQITVSYVGTQFQTAMSALSKMKLLELSLNAINVVVL